MTPVRVLACPVCFASSSKSVLHQFYATAAGLTLAPFVLVVGVALYLRHLGRRSASPSLAPDGTRSDPANPPAAPRNRLRGEQSEDLLPEL